MKNRRFCQDNRIGGFYFFNAVFCCITEKIVSGFYGCHNSRYFSDGHMMRQVLFWTTVL